MNREVYLGDRGILGIEINSWTSEVRVKIDVISFLFSEGDTNGDWDESENIEEGYLVFADIQYFELSPIGMMPGDYIIEYDFKEEGEMIVFTIHSISRPYCDKLSTMKIKSKNSWIEDKFKQKVI
ncbi:DUF6258 family protein [Escherichia albertii]|uniref:DUF6258 family protein n=1 Tax=Escherichia albertii TaxID=208962 RepID=UPI002119FA32|nr:DUF6258 family protein [Escherichia albertii]MCQ8983081.1 DUF6258 family protein [Escherichia albertii]MCQ9016623.1 DUF6258 family protein [Escherichia albertii]MCQ9017001.1 DUF6258 family protein [Escherichia albertii]UUL43142.1 DUF6258 family protein [Escherichia albertii]